MECLKIQMQLLQKIEDQSSLEAMLHANNAAMLVDKETNEGVMKWEHLRRGATYAFVKAAG